MKDESIMITPDGADEFVRGHLMNDYENAKFDGDEELLDTLVQAVRYYSTEKQFQAWLQI
jgi:hypothetical protein